MVDLLEVYRQHGFELDARELPDYIPLFLEYLAQRPPRRRWTCWPMPCTSWRCSAPGWLNATAIITSCSTRWSRLVGEPADIADIRQQAATEGPDQTILNMDKIWEEEAVTFLANQEGCGKNQAIAPRFNRCNGCPRSGSTPQAARSL
jgi:nitrate reductase delta subunit